MQMVASNSKDWPTALIYGAVLNKVINERKMPFDSSGKYRDSNNRFIWPV